MYLYHINTLTYVDLREDAVFGRTTGDIIIPDQMLSGKHCKIHVKGAELFLEDLGSKNRTILNRTEIIPFELMKLSKNFFIEIGGQSFIVTEVKTLSLEDIHDLIDRNQKKQVMRLEGVKLVLAMKDQLQADITKLQTTKSDNLQKIENKLQNISGQEAQVLEVLAQRDGEIQRLDQEKEKLLMKTNAAVSDINAEISKLKNDIAELTNQNVTVEADLEAKFKKAKLAEKSPGMENKTMVRPA